MATRHRTVAVVIEYLDHDHGHWCHTCALSTGIRVWVTVRQGHRMHIQERLHCYECEGSNITLDHQPG